MSSRTKIPAGPYSPSTHPPIVVDELEVGSLYIMISVPLPIYLGRQQHTYAAGVPSDPDYPYCTYELGVADGCFAEEFHWDLYWHTSDDAQGGAGVIYRLRNVTTRPPTFEYDRVPVVRVRTHAQLVGLLRVISVPAAVVPHLTRYLDWMTAESARVAQRSYVWASMAYYRARAHLTKGDGIRDHSFQQFDISRFTAEALSFAYREVPRVLEGNVAGPKPVVVSWLGIAMGFLEDDDVAATRRKRDELLRRQREEVGVVTACWYR